MTFIPEEVVIAHSQVPLDRYKSFPGILESCRELTGYDASKTIKVDGGYDFCCPYILNNKAFVDKYGSDTKLGDGLSCCFPCLIQACHELFEGHGSSSSSPFV